MKKLEIGQRAPDFTLPGVDGKDHSLNSYKDKKIVTVVFTCNHCPYVQAYEDRLISIQRDYAAKGVQLIAINANDSAGYPEDSFDNMIRRAKKKSFNFPYLRDKTQCVTRAYGAEYTPEAFVLNSRFELRYVGRIDDNWQNPDKVKTHDLRAAINAVLAHKKVENPVTHAIGCTIKWRL
ncbi:MAG TPA: thioredoxin family protein [Verrucomicrobiae bacterium]|nr:thioredoxin family protein [Verrucomicrobiae bacterium]